MSAGRSRSKRAARALRLITQEESWKQEVREDVVEQIRNLLERAEAGEIVGIAYSCVTADNMVLTGASKSQSQSAMIGGLERIKHKLIAAED